MGQAIDELFLELQHSRSVEAKTDNERLLELEVQQINSQKFNEAVEFLKGRGEHFALHHHTILLALERMSKEDAVKYFGTQLTGFLSEAGLVGWTA